MQLSPGHHIVVKYILNEFNTIYDLSTSAKSIVYFPCLSLALLALLGSNPDSDINVYMLIFSSFTVI